MWCQQDKHLQESIAANKKALVQQGILIKLLSLALAGGGVASAPVRTQVCLIPLT